MRLYLKDEICNTDALNPCSSELFVTFVVSSFHDTALTTPFLNLTQSFARYCQLFMIFEVSGVSKISITLAAGDTIVVLDAGRNSRVGINDSADLCCAPLSQSLLHAGHTYRLAIAAVRLVIT